MTRHSPRTALATWTAPFLLLAGAWLSVGPLPAIASRGDTAAEADFARRINGLRASEGIAALQTDPELDRLARNWAAQMVADGRISHNPDLPAGLPPGWTQFGENVGQGPDVESVFRAFEESPPHRHNLVLPEFTHLGVGVAQGEGALFTSHVFVAAAPPAEPEENR